VPAACHEPAAVFVALRCHVFRRFPGLQVCSASRMASTSPSASSSWNFSQYSSRAFASSSGGADVRIAALEAEIRVLTSSIQWYQSGHLLMVGDISEMKVCAPPMLSFKYNYYLSEGVMYVAAAIARCRCSRDLDLPRVRL
jgi:hypothetical protein